MRFKSRNSTADYEVRTWQLSSIFKITTYLLPYCEMNYTRLISAFEDSKREWNTFEEVEYSNYNNFTSIIIIPQTNFGTSRVITQNKITISVQGWLLPLAQPCGATGASRLLIHPHHLCSVTPKFWIQDVRGQTRSRQIFWIFIL